MNPETAAAKNKKSSFERETALLVGVEGFEPSE